MKKTANYLATTKLKNIILNRSSCELINFPTPGSEGHYQISVERNFHYPHTPIPKKVKEFSVTLKTKMVGYEGPDKDKQANEKKLFEINCDISGHFILEGQAEKLDDLRNAGNLFASQVGPYVKEHIDYLLLKMDLTSRGARFPFINFVTASEKPSKATKKKRVS